MEKEIDDKKKEEVNLLRTIGLLTDDLQKAQNKATNGTKKTENPKKIKTIGKLQDDISKLTKASQTGTEVVHQYENQEKTFNKEDSTKTKTSKRKKGKRRKSSNSKTETHIVNSSILNLSSVSGISSGVHLNIKNNNNNKNKNKNKKTKRVFVLGDSQVRGLGSLLANKSVGSDDLKITTSCRPNANLNQITEDIEGLTKGFTKDDVVFIMGGSNDIDSRKPSDVNKIIERLVAVSDKTNVIISQVPFRYDKVDHNLTRKNAMEINRKLTDFSKNSNSFHVIGLHGLRRHHFTTHGLHLNYYGKNFISEEILSRINDPNRSFLNLKTI